MKTRDMTDDDLRALMGKLDELACGENPLPAMLEEIAKAVGLLDVEEPFSKRRS